MNAFRKACALPFVCLITLFYCAQLLSAWLALKIAGERV